MAKSAPPPPPPASTLFAWLKLAITLLVLAGLAYAAKLAVAAVNDAIAQGKQALEGKGVKLDKSGVSVKTDKRAFSQEETEDRLQRSLMKGWKASSFNVGGILGATTNLRGSKHDKNKEEWERTHGPKKVRVQ